MLYFLGLVLVLCSTATAYAQSPEESEDNAPLLRYVNVDNVTTFFTISNSGNAKVTNTYRAKSGVFSRAEITTKIQKKYGFIWITVSGGSWTDTSTALNFSKSHSVQLSSTGTYRAHVVFKFYGTGDSDTITKNVERTYS